MSVSFSWFLVLVEKSYHLQSGKYKKNIHITLLRMISKSKSETRFRNWEFEMQVADWLSFRLQICILWTYLIYINKYVYVFFDWLKISIVSDFLVAKTYVRVDSLFEDVCILLYISYKNNIIPHAKLFWGCIILLLSYHIWQFSLLRYIHSTIQSILAIEEVEIRDCANLSLKASDIFGICKKISIIERPNFFDEMRIFGVIMYE